METEAIVDEGESTAMETSSVSPSSAAAAAAVEEEEEAVEGVEDHDDESDGVKDAAEESGNGDEPKDAQEAGVKAVIDSDEEAVNDGDVKAADDGDVKDVADGDVKAAFDGDDNGDSTRANGDATDDDHVDARQVEERSEMEKGASADSAKDSAESMDQTDSHQTEATIPSSSSSSSTSRAPTPTSTPTPASTNVEEDASSSSSSSALKELKSLLPSILEDDWSLHYQGAL